jgi:hypothetical protein
LLHALGFSRYISISFEVHILINSKAVTGLSIIKNRKGRTGTFRFSYEEQK